MFVTRFLKFKGTTDRTIKKLQVKNLRLSEKDVNVDTDRPL